MTCGPTSWVQFLPIVLIPMIMALFPARHSANAYLLSALGLYVLAKVLEHLNRPVLDATALISGHSLKHVAAAAAVLRIVRAVPTRT